MNKLTLLALLFLTLVACSSIGEKRYISLPPIIHTYDEPGDTYQVCWGLAPWTHKLLLPVYLGCSYRRHTYCDVYVTKGDKAALGHELKHCEGYVH